MFATSPPPSTASSAAMMTTKTFHERFYVGGAVGHARRLFRFGAVSGNGLFRSEETGRTSGSSG